MWELISEHTSRTTEEADAAATLALKEWLHSHGHSVPPGGFDAYFTKVDDVEDERTVELTYEGEHFKLRAYPEEPFIVTQLYREGKGINAATSNFALALGLGGLIGAGLFLLLRGGK
jgi:hypothetical protein